MRLHTDKHLKILNLYPNESIAGNLVGWGVHFHQAQIMWGSRNWARGWPRFTVLARISQFMVGKVNNFQEGIYFHKVNKSCHVPQFSWDLTKGPLSSHEVAFSIT